MKGYRVYGKAIGAAVKARPLHKNLQGKFTARLEDAAVFAEYLEAVEVASKMSVQHRAHQFEVREAK